MTGARDVAVFDLDGTITRHDTLFPYVIGWLAQRPWRLLRLLRAVPAAFAFCLRLTDRGGLKAALLRATLAGVTREELARWNAAHLPGVLEHRTFADALGTLEAHRARGDELILMSASVDFYVPEIARLLRFDAVLCTRVAWKDGKLAGDLVGENLRGEAKAVEFARLRAQRPGARFAAYGNSDSDLPHLRLAEDGVLVNGSASARRNALAGQVRCVSWS